MDRYADTPEVDSLGDAIAVVKSILAEMKPWPEEISVGDPDEFTGLLIFRDDERYALSRASYVKIAEVARDIQLCLRRMHVMPRMPELMIVMGDAVTWIWDDRIAYAPHASSEAPDWWPADGKWGGRAGWALHLVHCREDRCVFGCDCPHHLHGERD